MGMTWHRITYDRADWDFFDQLNSPATCSCGEKWAEGMYAIGHAYSANAILEEALEKKYDELDDYVAELVATGSIQ